MKLENRLEMVIKIARLILVLVASVPTKARAMSTGFEDLVPDTTYMVGDGFTSNGIDFEVVPLTAEFGAVVIDTNNSAAGDGLEVSTTFRTGISVSLPDNVRQISLKY